MKATLFLRLWRLHILCEAGRALSCAQAARAAARRGPMRRSACSAAAEEMLLSRSQTTRSIEGRERTDWSDCIQVQFSRITIVENNGCIVLLV